MFELRNGNGSGGSGIKIDRFHIPTRNSDGLTYKRDLLRLELGHGCKIIFGCVCLTKLASIHASLSDGKLLKAIWSVPNCSYVISLPLWAIGSNSSIIHFFTQSLIESFSQHDEFICQLIFWLLFYFYVFSFYANQIFLNFLPRSYL